MYLNTKLQSLIFKYLDDIHVYKLQHSKPYRCFHVPTLEYGYAMLYICQILEETHTYMYTRYASKLKFIERGGRIDTPTHKYMTAHFPSLVHDPLV
jgi:hypothetical protein